MGGSDNRGNRSMRRLARPGRRPDPKLFQTIAFDREPYDENGGTTGFAPATAPIPDPDVWTGSATVPGQAPGGWTQPYPGGLEPEPRRSWRPMRVPFGGHYGLAAVLLVGLVAVALLVVAASPTLQRLAFGRGTAPPRAMTSAAKAPGTSPTLTIEAESPDNTLIWSAFVGDYPAASGGRLVRAIGVWGGTKGPGALSFNNVMVPSTATYAVTFYFVNIKGQATRTAVITTTAGDSATVTVTDGTSTCCTSKSVDLQLQQGPNGITFANPNGQAPAIDRITVAPQN